MISNGKLLNENLAKLECLGGGGRGEQWKERKKKKKESDITLTLPSHMRKGIEGLVLTWARTKAMKIASHTEFKVIYFGTCTQISCC